MYSKHYYKLKSQIFFLKNENQNLIQIRWILLKPLYVLVVIAGGLYS